MSKPVSIYRPRRVANDGSRSQASKKSRQVTPVYSVDVTQFRAFVQELTGFSSSLPCPGSASPELIAPAAQRPLQVFHRSDEDPIYVPANSLRNGFFRQNYRPPIAQMMLPPTANSTNFLPSLIQSLKVPPESFCRSETGGCLLPAASHETRPHGQRESNLPLTPQSSPALKLRDFGIMPGHSSNTEYIVDLPNSPILRGSSIPFTASLPPHAPSSLKSLRGQNFAPGSARWYAVSKFDSLRDEMTLHQPDLHVDTAAHDEKR